METINVIFELLAKEIANNNEKLLQSFVEALLQTLNDRYVQPLQASKILKNVEVAKRLDVSPSTVTILIDTGRLPTTADGRVTEYHLWQYLTHDGKTTLSVQKSPSQSKP